MEQPVFDDGIISNLDSKDFFKFLLLESKSIISILSPIFDKEKIIDFKIVYVTENLEHYIAETTGNMLGDRISKLFPNVMENGIFEIWVACYNKQDLFIEYNREFAFPDKKVWFRNRARRISNAIMVVSEDITNLMETKEKLKQFSEQLEFQNTIMNDSQKSSRLASFRWVVGSDEWNFSKGVSLLFGDVDQDILQKKGLFTLLNTSEARDLKTRIKNSSNSISGHLEPFEFSKKNTSGLELHYIIIASFMPVSEGQLMVGVIQDNTLVMENRAHLEERNEKLMTMNEELDSFNHIASHDLQEPLRKIRMFISRLLEVESMDRDENERRYIHKIDASANRMQKLINQLLDYSRIGKKPLDFETVALGSIIGKALEELEEVIAHSGASVHVDELSSILGVPILLRQLFVNLISNAIKYRREDVPPIVSIKGRIVLPGKRKTYAGSNWVKAIEITVTDNGIGFDKVHAEKIFGLFKRLHSRSEYPGTGIGLAICRKIVEYHGGYIHASSEKGKGSIFTIILPIFESPPKPSTGP